MAYRKFWLTNGESEKYDITDFYNTALAINPTGLGATAAVSLTRLGNSRIANSLQWELKDINLDLLFMNDGKNVAAYDQYKKFLTFISKLPVFLHYQTPDMTTSSYFKEVIITNVDKTEVAIDTSTLNCPITITPLTMWKSSEETIIEVSQNRGKGKSYQLKRPYIYAGNDIENIIINNNSNISIPLIIEIDGVCENPYYTLYDYQLRQYGAGRFLGRFEYVYMNSEDLNEDIQLKKDGAYLPNAISYQDASIGSLGNGYLTFLYLAPGRNTLKFNFNNDFKGKVIIRMRDNYVSV